MILNENDSFNVRILAEEQLLKVADAYQRPSAIFRPGLSIDGNKWCALYGENLQDGVAGFGDSPALAMLNFDHEWERKLGEAWKP